MATNSSSLLFGLLVLFAALTWRSIEGRWVPTAEEDAELEAQLKQLNKPAVKTIQSVINGELFDCVDMYKQPAFDHPLLKDHKIQLRPSRSLRKELRKNSATLAESAAIRFGSYNESCPAGTVLIRRTSTEDLIASRNIPGRFSREISETTVKQPPEIQYAKFQSRNTAFVGFKAELTVWEIPSVEGTQYSSGAVSVVGPTTFEANHVGAGWHVYPSIYGNDKRPRLYAYWTSDDSWETGCFNLLCSGFVQISDKFGPGSIISEVSKPGAERHILIAILKDERSKDWWLYAANEYVGYWPMKIFDNMDLSKMIAFGGLTYSPLTQKTPAMGNGKFPGQGSAYFRNVQFADIDHRGLYTPDNNNLTFYVSLDKYYKIWKDSATDANFNIPYGGPGGYMPS